MINVFEAHELYDGNYLYGRKRLELLNIVSIGTYCYICENMSECIFNEQKVCKSCFDGLESADKESHVYNESRYYSFGDNLWYEENFLTKNDNKNYCSYHMKKIDYQTKIPEKLLLKAFLVCISKNVKLPAQNCINCGKSSSHFDDDEICKYCLKLSITHFLEIDVYHYLVLKLLLNYDSAKYTVLYYLKLKLIMCSK